MYSSHKDTIELLELACSVPVSQAVVNREIYEELPEYARVLPALSREELGILRESAMKIAALIYMSYSVKDPGIFERMLRCATPAKGAGSGTRLEAMPWILEHRMIRKARMRTGNLLQFNLNQSRLASWHNQRLR